MIIINDNFIIPFLSLNDFLSDTHDRVKFRLEWSLEQKKAGLQNNTLEKNLSIGTLYPKNPSIKEKQTFGPNWVEYPSKFFTVTLTEETTLLPGRFLLKFCCISICKLEWIDTCTL